MARTKKHYLIICQNVRKHDIIIVKFRNVEKIKKEILYDYLPERKENTVLLESNSKTPRELTKKYYLIICQKIKKHDIITAKFRNVERINKETLSDYLPEYKENAILLESYSETSIALDVLYFRQGCVSNVIVFFKTFVQAIEKVTCYNETPLLDFTCVLI